MTGYVTTDEYSTSTSQLIERLVSLETATPDYSSLMSKAEAEADHAALETVIASKATPADVAAVAAQIPDVSNYLSTARCSRCYCEYYDRVSTTHRRRSNG